MRAIRIPYAEMVKVAHDLHLSIEPDYALRLAFMYRGRKEYVADLPPALPDEAAS